MTKSERIKKEATELWIETFGEAPSTTLRGEELLDLLLKRMDAPGYARLARADRERNLTWPR